MIYRTFTDLNGRKYAFSACFYGLREGCYKCQHSHCDVFHNVDVGLTIKQSEMQLGISGTISAMLSATLRSYLLHR